MQSFTRSVSGSSITRTLLRTSAVRPVPMCPRQRKLVVHASKVSVAELRQVAEKAAQAGAEVRLSPATQITDTLQPLLL